MIAGRDRNYRIAQPLEKIASVAASHKLIRINALRQRLTIPQLYRPPDCFGRFPSVSVSAILRTHANTNAEFLSPSGKGRDGNTQGTGRSAGATYDDSASTGNALLRRGWRGVLYFLTCSLWAGFCAAQGANAGGEP